MDNSEIHHAPAEGGALSIARDALEEIALAGMSGSGQESEEGMRDWHARQAWKFIGVAARALEAIKAAAMEPKAQPKGTAELTDAQLDAAMPKPEQFGAPAAPWDSRDRVILRTAMRAGAALVPQAPAPAPDEWRKLAQQFDGQRMAAMAHLRTLLDNPQTHAVAARAFLAATPAEQIASVQAPAVAPRLTEDDVQWIVNDLGELGVMVNGQAFFLYKGYSLVYQDATHDETGEPMHYRPVFKREFGECAHPINYQDPTRIGTVSLDDSDKWRELPPAKPPVQGSQP